MACALVTGWTESDRRVRAEPGAGSCLRAAQAGPRTAGGRALLSVLYLDEHENPGEATIQVLRGRVRLTAGQITWDGRTGDLLVVPDARHALAATEDSAILLTVSKTRQAS
jgi:gentisate 1,2-dioxygenase